MRIMKSKLCLSIGTSLLSVAITTAHAASAKTYQTGKTIANDPFLKAVVSSEHMEPAIIHPAQSVVAQKKIEAYKQKTGRTPNILIFIVDDMGWGISVRMVGVKRWVHRHQILINWHMGVCVLPHSMHNH